VTKKTGILLCIEKPDKKNLKLILIITENQEAKIQNLLVEIEF